MTSLPGSVKRLLVEHLGYAQIGRPSDEPNKGVESQSLSSLALDTQSSPSITSDTAGDNVDLGQDIRAETPPTTLHPQPSDQVNQAQYHESTDTFATCGVTDLEPNAPAPSPLAASDPDLTSFVHHGNVEFLYPVMGAVECAIDRLKEEHLCEIHEILLSSLTLAELNRRCQDLSALFETRRHQLYTLLAPRVLI